MQQRLQHTTIICGILVSAYPPKDCLHIFNFLKYHQQQPHPHPHPPVFFHKSEFTEILIHIFNFSNDNHHYYYYK
jgi:hypothetical protein